jgi:hypothetical protein
MRRSIRIVASLPLIVAFVLGCGGKFKLPTENTKNKVIPPDGSYQMQDTWRFNPASGPGMDGITDILLTQGLGTQLFLLFSDDHGQHDTGPRGRVESYGRFKQGPFPAPVSGVTFSTLFNPIALAAGGDGGGSPANRIYVLDRGDTCIGRANPSSGACDDTSHGFTGRVTNLTYYWKVREFRLLGGDTVSTFTDTTMAFVNGVAADEQGRVYVSGLAIVYVPDPLRPSQRDRSFLWRIYRYERGPGAPNNSVFPDPYMVGQSWHRDHSWKVENGNGDGFIIGPYGLTWNPYGGGGVYTAELIKNDVQRLSDSQSNTGLLRIPELTSELQLGGPLDVAVDLKGFVYVADTGNQRVLRYDPYGSYVQRVNVEHDALGDTLRNPVTVACDDSLVFIGDLGHGPATNTARVNRYKRRQ